MKQNLMCYVLYISSVLTWKTKELNAWANDKKVSTKMYYQTILPKNSTWNENKFSSYDSKLEITYASIISHYIVKLNSKVGINTVKI